MSSLNKVQLIGNLGKDPETRHTNDGRPICNFSVATGEQWKDKNTGEKNEKTEWHNVVIFNEALAKVADAYLKKGSTVYVEGKLRTRKWQDKDGVDRYSTEVILENFDGKLVLLGGKQSDEASSIEKEVRQSFPEAKAGPVRQRALDDLDDSVPF